MALARLRRCSTVPTPSPTVGASRAAPASAAAHPRRAPRTRGVARLQLEMRRHAPPPPPPPLPLPLRTARDRTPTLCPTAVAAARQAPQLAIPGVVQDERTFTEYVINFLRQTHFGKRHDPDDPAAPPHAVPVALSVVAQQCRPPEAIKLRYGAKGTLLKARPRPPSPPHPRGTPAASADVAAPPPPPAVEHNKTSSTLSRTCARATTRAASSSLSRTPRTRRCSASWRGPARPAPRLTRRV